MKHCKGLLGECNDCTWPNCEPRTREVAHPHRYVRKNGTVVYVTTAHRNRLYRRGDWQPNYPMPAIRYQLDYHRDLDNQVVAVSLWNEGQASNPICLEYWP